MTQSPDSIVSDFGHGASHVILDEAHRIVRKRIDTLDRLRRELRREPPHVVDQASDLFKIILGAK